MKRMTFWGENEADESLINEVIYQGKTVTCTPKVWYYNNPDEEPTNIGDLVAIYNAKNIHCCTVKIIDNYEIPFGKITERIYQGELCNSVEEFKKAHLYCWEKDLHEEGYELNDDTIIVVEHFKLMTVERKRHPLRSGSDLDGGKEMIDGIFKDTMVNMKWTDIECYANKNALVLLPLGVIEEHGPHLCLGTDIMTAHLYCLSIKEKLEQEGYPVVIAPPFYWGVCQSTGGFIGSFRVRKETSKALLYDILTSLAEFGFNNIYGVNAHGDIEHNIAIIEAFKEATEQLKINACYAFDEWRLPHFGFSGDEPYLCPIKPQSITVSTAEVPDVHGGDIETATIYKFYPHLVDVEKAKSLAPVALANDKVEQWLFGGHIKELSAEGYIGTPANYESVDAQSNVDDYACRISTAILGRIVPKS